MRFFDEDNNRFEWTIGVVVTIVVLYLGSYLIIRTRNTSPCESEGCYYQIVDISQKGIWNVFAPLTAIDHKYFRAEFTIN